jgi:beta-aspartyl-peptidase (threonine type)
MSDPPSTAASWSAQGAGACVLVHGGAGTRRAEELPGERQGCMAAARAAHEVLRAGGSALDAVQRAVELMEDDARFNAGTGGALTRDGTLELDAAIMDGRDLRAGAVCCLPPHRHPIAVARAVLDEGLHVLYAADGAAALAARAGFAPAAPGSMITDAARAQLARVLATQQPAPGGNTVGAVARDAHGHVAAATSTGGIAGKRSGRVGDSPLLGAGTYADDRCGAASATGHGEGILRLTLCARVLSDVGAGRDAQDAASSRIVELATRVGSRAGVILVAPSGRLALARSTTSMPWAAVWDGADAGGD